ncbi:MAG: hypothetical protein EBZ74_12530 [Planctomycetia bacterium]|nr:hypothetical protein [Planctomycetia bacterium]
MFTVPPAMKNARSPAPALACDMSIVAPLPLITRPDVFAAASPINICADGWIVPLVAKLIVKGPEPIQAFAAWMAAARSPAVVTLDDWPNAAGLAHRHVAMQSRRVAPAE